MGITIFGWHIYEGIHTKASLGENGAVIHERDKETAGSTKARRMYGRVQENGGCLRWLISTYDTAVAFVRLEVGGGNF